MNQEDKVFLVVAIVAAGFIAYKATRKDDIVAEAGYANAAGHTISHTRWQPDTVAPPPVKPTTQGQSAKPMWQKKLAEKIFFWRKPH